MIGNLFAGKFTIMQNKLKIMLLKMKVFILAFMKLMKMMILHQRKYGKKLIQIME